MLGPLSIAIWNDIVEEYDDEFNEWHTREHMLERIGIKGFLRGRRYEAIDASIRYFTLYELEGEEVLTGPDYKARLNAPTTWSLQSTALFLNNYRGVCDVVTSRSLQAGGNAVVARIDVREEALPSIDRLEALATKALAWDAVCGVHIMRCNRGLSGTRTALQASRQIHLPETVIMIDVARASYVPAVTASLGEEIPVVLPGREATIDTYRLQCEIRDQPLADVMNTSHPKAWQ